MPIVQNEIEDIRLNHEGQITEDEVGELSLVVSDSPKHALQGLQDVLLALSDDDLGLGVVNEEMGVDEGEDEDDSSCQERVEEACVPDKVTISEHYAASDYNGAAFYGQNPHSSVFIVLGVKVRKREESKREEGCA